jgi:hypothetical protein
VLSGYVARPEGQEHLCGLVPRDHMVTQTAQEQQQQRQAQASTCVSRELLTFPSGHSPL